MHKTKVTVALCIAAVTPLLFASPVQASNPSDSKMRLVKTFTGSLSPKSVTASQSGLVSAHNMMYQHSVSIFDSRSLELVTTVKDSVSLSGLGVPGFSGTYKGAPVEGAFSPDSQYLYFTNYAMYGKGLNKEGHDVITVLFLESI
jgi:hypothetical protein